MTDNDWPLEPPHPNDPVLGSDLDAFRPDSTQRAAVTELMLAYTARETLFGDDFLTFAANAYREKSWPQMFLAALEHFYATAVGTQGSKLAIERLSGDLLNAREDALIDRGHNG